jgi:hypothetical protein
VYVYFFCDSLGPAAAAAELEHVTFARITVSVFRHVVCLTCNTYNDDGDDNDDNDNINNNKQSYSFSLYF